MILEHKTLQYKGQVVFEKLVIGNFQRMPKPFNDNEACFMYIQEGSFQFRTPEKVLEFNVGDGMLAKCSDYFFEQTKTDHETTSRTQGIGAYLYPNVIKELFDLDLTLSDFETDYDATKINIDTLLKHFIDGIDVLLDNPSVADDAMVKVKMKEFLLLLAKTESAPSLLDFFAALFKPYEYNFKQVIEQNILSTLTIVELAKLCGMSVSTFQRTFQSVYDQTPSKYICLTEIEH